MSTDTIDVDIIANTIEHRSGQLNLSFQYLRNQIGRSYDACPSSTRVRIEWPVNMVFARLDAELVLFHEILADFGDLDRVVDEADWDILERAIKIRCGAYYGRYLTQISRMLAAVRSIADFTGITQDSAPWTQNAIYEKGYSAATTLSDVEPVSKIDSSRFALAICSIGGSLGGQFDANLAQIGEANDTLRTIRRKVREPASMVPFKNIEVLRQQMERAAVILGPQHGFACSHERHEAFFRIDRDFDSLEVATEPERLDGSFSLLFKTSVADNTPTFVRVSAKTIILEDSNQPKGNMPHAPTPPSKTKRVVTKNRVKIAGFFSPLARYKNQDKDREQRTDDTISSDPAEGLCSFLNSHISGNGISDSTSILLSRQRHEFQLKLTLDPGMQEQYRGASQIIDLHSRNSNPALLAIPTEQKLKLAIKITSSLLYLHSTSWLTKVWDTRDVFVLLGRQNEKTVYPMLANRADSQDTSPSEVIEPIDSTTHLNQLISSLGKFLVELWCGVPWKRIRELFLEPSEVPKEDSDADILVVTRILSWASNPAVAEKNKSFYLEGSCYADAVQNCFFTDFGQCTKALADEEICSGVFERILLPLYNALDDFYDLQNRLYGPVNSEQPPLKANNPSPQGVHHLMLFDDSNPDKHSKEKIDSADKWWQSYRKVAKLAQKIRKLPALAQDRIKLAILDTGVDVTDDYLNRFWGKRQIIYKNFVEGKCSNDFNPQDDHGHGTFIASVIFKMAQNIDVYVARVSKHGKDWNETDVEKGLQWACEEKVHIISISFGFPRIEQRLEPIRRGILRAHAADIVIFAAASNEGKGHHIAFPACMDEVICVSSTDGSGDPSSFNPILKPGKRLCAIGESSEGSWPRKLNPKGEIIRRSGTSYATPVVAGAIAMVMDCVWSIRTKCSDEAQTMRTKRGVLAVMSLMLARIGDIETLTPWLLFDEEKNGKTVVPESERDSIWQGNGILILIIGALKSAYG